MIHRLSTEVADYRLELCRNELGQMLKIASRGTKSPGVQILIPHASAYEFMEMIIHLVAEMDRRRA